MAHRVRSKDETDSFLEKFVELCRNTVDPDAKVCDLRTDQRTKFIGEYTQVLNRSGAENQLTCPDTPEHNNVVERFNITIQNRVREYVHDSELPSSMLDLALGAADYVYNPISHKSNEMKIPLEKFAPGNKFDIN